MGLTKCPFITNTQMKHTKYAKEMFYIMLLLPNCEFHMGKYLDRSFEVRTERKWGPNEKLRSKFFRVWTSQLVNKSYIV